MSWFSQSVDRACGSPRRPAPVERAAEFARFLRIETVGGTLLLLATAAALIWANSPVGDSYAALRDYRLGPAAIGLDLNP